MMELKTSVCSNKKKFVFATDTCFLYDFIDKKTFKVNKYLSISFKKVKVFFSVIISHQNRFSVGFSYLNICSCFL